MLDQNALTYMVERTIEKGHGARLVNINALARPSERVISLFEFEQARVAEQQLLRAQP
jgi:hypothetical protein